MIFRMVITSINLLIQESPYGILWHGKEFLRKKDLSMWQFRISYGLIFLLYQAVLIERNAGPLVPKWNFPGAGL